MKKKFFIWLISFASTAIVLICLIYGYFTAKNGITKYIDVRDNKTDVLYEEKTPQNFGIMLNLPQNEGVFFYLDFSQNEMVLTPFFGADEAEGFSFDTRFNIDISYELFGEIVDRVGGIDVMQEGEEMRITGITAAEMLKTNAESKEEILSSFSEQIAENGLTKSDFLYISENCESTDITLIELFPIKDHIFSLMNNIRT